MFRQKNPAFALIALLVLGFAALYAANPQMEDARKTEKGLTRKIQDRLPFTFMSGEGKHARLEVTLDYAPWRNATFSIEPFEGCVQAMAIRPSSADGASYALPDMTPICTEKIMDLRPYLKPGINRIRFDIVCGRPQTIYGTMLFISPELLGAHWLSTLGCLLIGLASAGVVFLLFRKGGLDIPVCLMAALAFVYYACLLHYRPNLAYGNDYLGHIAYTRYMVDGWMYPYGYNGWEHFHPPLYYFVAAQFFDLSSLLGVVNPLTAVRGLDLALYMAFCLFGVKTLAEFALKAEGGRFSYYVGAMLIIFWPLGPVMATRLNNDLAVFAAWGAAFYYLARWYDTRDSEALRAALILTGITYMIKSNATVLLGVVGTTMLYALLMRRLSFRELLARRVLTGFAVLGFGMIASVGRVIYKWLTQKQDVTHLYLGDANKDWHPARYYAHFDFLDYGLHPTVTYEHEPGFFNYFLKTLLYSEQQMGGFLVLPRILNLLLVLLILLTFGGLALRRVRERDTFVRFMPYIAGTLIPVLGSIGFMVMKTYMFCQNARYVLPMLIPLIVLFIRGIEPLAVSPNALLRCYYWFAMAVGMALSVLGIVLCVWLYAVGEG